MWSADRRAPRESGRRTASPGCFWISWGVFYGITHMPPQILFHVLIKSVIPFHLGNRHMQHIFQSLIEIKPHRIFMQRGIFSVDSEAFIKELLMHRGDSSFCTKLFPREIFSGHRFRAPLYRPWNRRQSKGFPNFRMSGHREIAHIFPDSLWNCTPAQSR